MGETATVRLPGGFLVRQRFVRKVLGHVPDRFPVGLTYDVEIVDGERTVHMIVISDEGLEPLTDDVLRRLDLVDALDGVMTVEAQEVTADRGYDPAELEGTDRDTFTQILDRDATAAMSAVKKARRRRKITPELLADVLRLYDRDGIEAVQEGIGVSQSYAWKLLRKARDQHERSAS